ncbi:MAG TPA: 50S ribosomal protein L11 methyltransferase, partial [Bacillota bacterium]|nr:50S ribosomal protein L11 methyltransferase [Bacillota bacterium]
GRTPQCYLRQIREDDWAQAWKAYFKPERIGKVVIKPSWEEYHPVAGEVIVELDPGMAFGTGNHPTTRLCIEQLQELIDGPLTMLDLGTGSGILSVVGAKLGATRVTASDIDPVAVRVARENVAANRVEDTVTVTEANLLQGHSVVQYDLVVANIIADIIVRLIPDVPNVLKPQGLFLASGIIAERSEEVQQALTAAGFVIQKVAARDNWVAIIAGKSPASAGAVES